MSHDQNLTTFLTAAASALLLLALAGPASAQTYPSKPVTFIVPYAAGGTGDIVARIIAEKLSGALGQSVVVENRAGATGSIGTRAVIAAAPDGHTLLMGQTGEIAITPNWGKGTGYHPDKDLAPVALATVVPLALVAPGKASYANVDEMVKAAAAVSFSFASAGTGTPGHFAGELLKLRTKGNFAHVPYKGAGPALNDLLGGHVQFFFSGFPAAIPHVQAGSLKLLAVSSAKRSGSAPTAPAVAETAGLAGFEITLWQGFFAPRETPTAIVERLNTEINRIIEQPDVKKKLAEAGADASPLSVAAFTTFTQNEGRKFSGIIKEIGLPAP